MSLCRGTRLQSDQGLTEALVPHLGHVTRRGLLTGVSLERQFPELGDVLVGAGFRDRTTQIDRRLALADEVIGD